MRHNEVQPKCKSTAQSHCRKQPQIRLAGQGVAQAQPSNTLTGEVTIARQAVRGHQTPDDLFDPAKLPDDLKLLVTQFKLQPTDPVWLRANATISSLSNPGSVACGSGVSSATKASTPTTFAGDCVANIHASASRQRVRAVVRRRSIADTIGAGTKLKTSSAASSAIVASAPVSKNLPSPLSPSFSSRSSLIGSLIDFENTP